MIAVTARNALCTLLYYTGAYRLYRDRQPGNDRAIPETVILNYHRIGRQRFDAHVRLLRRQYTIASLHDLVERSRRREQFPGPTVVITFDDGNRCCYTEVFPVLARYRVPATIFLTTGYVNTPQLLWFDAVEHGVMQTACRSLSYGGSTYPMRSRGDRQHAAQQIVEHLKTLDEATKLQEVERLQAVLGVPPDPSDEEPYRCLSWAQVSEMAAAGVAFGGHTVTHPILTRVPPEQAEREIAESKATIEAHLGTPVRHFAYPNGKAGDFNDEIIRLVQRHGYDCALSTIPGRWTPEDNPYALNRVIVTENTGAAALMVKLSGLWDRMMRLSR